MRCEESSVQMGQVASRRDITPCPHRYQEPAREDIGKDRAAFSYQHAGQASECPGLWHFVKHVLFFCNLSRN